LGGVPRRATLVAMTNPVAGCHLLFARDRRAIMMASWYRALFPKRQVARCRRASRMPRQSALRNIPLLSRPAYDAAKNRLELWQDAASERLETWAPRKWVANFFVDLSGSWCMMQITDHAWKDTITQIEEKDSAACERDGLDVVPAGSMTKVRSFGSAAAW
jgi:hypothetical protein